jgi:hypothetical protein
MKAEVGDRILLETEKVGQPARAGVVEEVLEHKPPRLRVRWDDGHSSIVAPSSGALRVESAQAERPRSSVT